MHKQDFKTPEEAIQFAKELTDDGKVAMAYGMPDGTAFVKWITNGKYVDFHGKEQLDEVWMTQQGVIMNVAELSEDHAKNILRMILRKEREAQDVYAKMQAGLQDVLEQALSGMMGESVEDEDEDDDFPSLTPPDPNRVTLQSILDDSPPPKGSLLN